jgi:hypothetical protein
MSTPFSTMRPLLGGRLPAIRLNTVVLPAPLGPIRPVMLPAGTENETPSTTRAPPNLRVTSVIWSIGRGGKRNRGAAREGLHPRPA